MVRAHTLADRPFLSPVVFVQSKRDPLASAGNLSADGGILDYERFNMPWNVSQ